MLELPSVTSGRLRTCFENPTKCLGYHHQSSGAQTSPEDLRQLSQIFGKYIYIQISLYICERLRDLYCSDKKC